MSVLKKVVKAYRTEGLSTLLKRSIARASNTLYPKPTVTNNSTPFPFWLLKYPYNALFTVKHGSGTDIMDEDWDTLILLDACRFDDFSDINSISGDLTHKISQGVDSRRFIERNFVGKDIHDTVYVTANPHVRLVDNDIFHDVITEPISNWDSEMQCVRPGDVTASAIEAHEKYPNKRIIVHYMQPHDPPLGPTAEKLREKAQIGGAAPNERRSQGKRIMELVATGEISEEAAREAYRETLEIVLEDVDTLLKNIAGKVVISSDHGEMFGERPYLLLGKLYEHYRNPKTVELCKVPWLIVERGSKRRNITVESRTEATSAIDTSELEEQLEALGYKN
ncbi:hypothetical protein [Natrinema versiforme]|uniref:Sulfatase N-terminal domain-containing protein n=1 Tax=Natrinema versiforme TaxID=88724 RepID=A0A4P8WJD6_9EURY|nr:hypothetical protein [Natrinema versiforme]QCS42021.1 hypothetical protein FEJ81_06490 [Natrinema versiforme]